MADGAFGPSQQIARGFGTILDFSQDLQRNRDAQQEIKDKLKRQKQLDEFKVNQTNMELLTSGSPFGIDETGSPFLFTAEDLQTVMEASGGKLTQRPAEAFSGVFPVSVLDEEGNPRTILEARGPGGIKVPLKGMFGTKEQMSAALEGTPFTMEPTLTAEEQRKRAAEFDLEPTRLKKIGAKGEELEVGRPRTRAAPKGLTQPQVEEMMTIDEDLDSLAEALRRIGTVTQGRFGATRGTEIDENDIDFLFSLGVNRKAIPEVGTRIAATHPLNKILQRKKKELEARRASFEAMGQAQIAESVGDFEEMDDESFDAALSEAMDARAVTDEMQQEAIRRGSIEEEDLQGE